jgi:hypothetical protein
VSPLHARAGKMVEWDGERWVDKQTNEEVDPLGR